MFVDVDNRVKVDRAQFDYSRLRLLDSQLVSDTLSEGELNAIAAHLRANVPQFAEKTRELSDAEVRAIINRSSVLELERKAPPGAQPLPDDVLYRRGKVSTFCTLVLSGKLAVLAGKDAFRAEAGPWTLLGAGALRDESFVPDFSAHVATDSVRCVYLSHAEKSNAPRRARKDDMRRSPSRERRRLRRDRRVGDRRGARSALGLGRELGRPAGRRDPSSRSLSFDSPVRGTPPPVT